MAKSLLSLVTVLFVISATGCRPTSESAAGASQNKKESLAKARKGFQTNLVRKESAKEPLPEPPASVFRIVSYQSPAGKMAAYLSVHSKDGKKRPAIIWITGGDCNTIGDVWSPHQAKNDQTASAYRKAGIVMMFPSLRGGNRNPGVREGFLGEVDDVLAARDWLAKQEEVDPSRIYLGGHSTGGTLALLVSECTDQFRGIFCFGPVHDPSQYDDEYVPFNAKDSREVMLRAPMFWLHSIKSPTYMIEGKKDGNGLSLLAMASTAKQDNLQNIYSLMAANHDHFSVLAPANKLIAAKILADTGAAGINLTEEEINKAK